VAGNCDVIVVETTLLAGHCFDRARLRHWARGKMPCQGKNWQQHYFPSAVGQADHFFGALGGSALILKVWAGNVNPHSGQSWSLQHLPSIFCKARNRTHA